VEDVRPVLKWAGGKRQLLPALRPFYPDAFACYFEPFVGSGAVFLDLLNCGRIAGHEVRLSDTNADIIGCYGAIRDSVEDVIAALWKLDEGHRAAGREHFYEVRDQRFNPARRSVHAGSLPAEAYTPELAAMLIYLNRTGYNGLFRVNSRGGFNVPAGRHATVRICDPDNLRRLSAAFGAPEVSLEVQPFDRALASAGRGDFVYLDPPYSPVSRTSNFTAYTSARFGVEEQASLQRSVIEIASRGAHVLLSNSFAPEISALYEKNAAAREAGLRTRTVQARRAINSRGSRRGPVPEYLITNVPGAVGRGESASKRRPPSGRAG
jgi:DNA adenine methylase